MSFRMDNFARRVNSMSDKRIEVFLREYDASPFGAVKPAAEFFAKFLGPVFPRTSFEWLKRKGIVHTAIELRCGNTYERMARIEIHFGQDGIIYSEPGESGFGNDPQKVTKFGYTDFTIEEIQAHLRKLGTGEFAKGTYDLFDHNCNNFTDRVCKTTVRRGIDKDILDAPNTVIGASLLAITKVAVAFPFWLKYIVPSLSWLAWPISLFSVAISC